MVPRNNSPSCQRVVLFHDGPPANAFPALGKVDGEEERKKKKRMRGDKAFIKKERAADKRLFSC